MRNRGWLFMLVLTPSLTGCAPDGPREFYRGALAARSELVDSLVGIVDGDRRLQGHWPSQHHISTAQICGPSVRFSLSTPPAIHRIRSYLQQ